MTEKVLIVDDDERLLSGLKRYLRKRFNLVTASTGQEALELVRNEGPFAVVICDMHMPGMNGIEVLKAVRELAPDTVRMMFTGDNEHSVAVDSVNQGQIFRFLQKPCNDDTLVAALESGVREFDRWRNERLRMKEEFLSIINHELRTPLNAILGFSEAMKEECMGPLGCPQYLEYAEHIHMAGSRLRDMITDILDMQAIVAGKLPLERVEIDFAVLVGESLKGTRDNANNCECVLEFVGSPDEHRVLGDRHRLRLAFGKLLSNAEKFSGGSSTIRVVMGSVENAIRVGVSDSGPGLSHPQPQRLFEMFSQEDSSHTRAFEGLGIGLAIARGIIETHGGRIWFEQPENGGTTVLFELPKIAEGCGQISRGGTT